MSVDPALRDQILAAIPSLRAFAISLSGNVDRADDLVQETILRALAKNRRKDGRILAFATLKRLIDRLGNRRAARSRIPQCPRRAADDALIVGPARL